MTVDSGPMQAAIDAMPPGYAQAFTIESAEFIADLRANPARTPLWRALITETARRRAANDPTTEAWQAWADAAIDAHQASPRANPTRVKHTTDEPATTAKATTARSTAQTSPHANPTPDQQL